MSDRDPGFSFKKVIPPIAGSNAPYVLNIDQEQKGRAWGSLFRKRKTGCWLFELSCFSGGRQLTEVDAIATIKAKY